MAYTPTPLSTPMLRRSWSNLAIHKKVTFRGFIVSSIYGTTGEFLPSWIAKDGSLSEIAQLFQRIADNAKLNVDILELCKEYRKFGSCQPTLIEFNVIRDQIDAVADNIIGYLKKPEAILDLTELYEKMAGETVFTMKDGIYEELHEMYSAVLQ